MNISSSSTRIALGWDVDSFADKYQLMLDKSSSGNRYSSFSENPINVARSIVLETQINSNNNILSNIALGNDLLAIAQGGEENAASNLSKITDLCEQALNGTYNDSDKDAILSEIRNRLAAINAIAEQTTFSGKTLLNGSITSMPFQLSPTSGDYIDVADALLDIRTSSLNIDIDPTETGATWSNADIQDFLTRVKAASKAVTTSSIELGGYSKRLDNAENKLNYINENFIEWKSELSDADIAETSADLVKFQIMEETSVTLLAQANQMASSVFRLLTQG